MLLSTGNNSGHRVQGIRVQEIQRGKRAREGVLTFWTSDAFLFFPEPRTLNPPYPEQLRVLLTSMEETVEMNGVLIS
jgi:hypothetical protein